MLTPSAAEGVARDMADRVVFLLDIDNTLLDNDRFAADLGVRLRQNFGVHGRDRYWALYAAVRDKLGYADYLTPLQELRAELVDDPDLLQLSGFMLDYPFAERLYPDALATVEHLHTLGTPVVLSDGDVVFQPRKIQRSGIWDAVQGRVLIFKHKQHMLDAVQHRFPAAHYVMIDDKPLLLAAMKTAMGNRLTTVFVRQGHYAREAVGLSIDPPPDLTIERIGELVDVDLQRFRMQPARGGGSLSASALREQYEQLAAIE